MFKSLSASVLLLALVAVLSWAGIARADEEKIMALKGTLACAKCVLHEEGVKECQSVLQVKDGDKTVNYYLTSNDISKPAHPKVCKAAVENVTVTGVVTEKDGKKWLAATKIEFPKQEND
jgi:hypothetical protein